MKFATSIDDLAVTLDVTSYHPGSPGSWNPRDGGSPPEGAEAEFRVLLTCPAGKNAELDITAYLPDHVLDALHEAAIELSEEATADFEAAIGEPDDGYNYGDK